MTVVLFVVFLSIAQTLSDKPVSALIAGLGLGGLAFALAAQDTIKNSIWFFGNFHRQVKWLFGDRVSCEGHDGVIEEVGLRSTRLRRLDGHQVTIPNGELANKSIHTITSGPSFEGFLPLG